MRKGRKCEKEEKKIPGIETKFFSKLTQRGERKLEARREGRKRLIKDTFL